MYGLLRLDEFDFIKDLIIALHRCVSDKVGGVRIEWTPTEFKEFVEALQVKSAVTEPRASILVVVLDGCVNVTLVLRIDLVRTIETSHDIALRK